MLFYLANKTQLFGENNRALMPTTFSVRAVYSDGVTTFEEDFFIELASFLGSTFADDPLVEKLEDIGKALDRLRR